MGPPEYKLRSRGLGMIGSGVGGVSLLADIRKHSSNHDVMYLADTYHVPYGGQTIDWMCGRARDLRFMRIEMGAQALRPSASMKFGNANAALGAVYFLNSSSIEQLVAENKQTDFISNQCIGQADVIETGDLDADEPVQLATRYVAAIPQRNVSRLVLGCTYYSLIKVLIAKIAAARFPIIEPSRVVARQMVRRVTKVLASENKPVSVSVYTNGDLSVMAKILSHQDLPVDKLSII